MRVLITGATGLIGKETGKRLVLAGHEVVAMSRDPDRAKKVLPFPARILYWEGGESEFPQVALDGVHGIINLAGESVANGRWSTEQKIKIRDSRVLGTRSLIQALVARNESILHPHKSDQMLKVFVQGSAVGIYGSRGDEVLDEFSERGAGFLSDVVDEWESEANKLKLHDSSQSIRLAIVRTGIVLSRREGALSKMLPVFSRGLGGYLGKGQSWMSWVHIEDIANLFIHCLQDDRASGIINGVSKEPVRNDRFTVALARALGRSVFLPVPETALKVGLGEMASALLSSERVISRRSAEIGFEPQHPELVPALRELCQPLVHRQHEYVSEQWIAKTPEAVEQVLSDEQSLDKITALKQCRYSHDLVPMAGGTLLRDRLVYKLPFGIIGDTVAAAVVEHQLKKIFSERRNRVSSRLSSHQ